MHNPRTLLFSAMILACCTLLPSAHSAWETIMREDFEGYFPSAGWQVFDNHSYAGDVYWDDDSHRSWNGGWSAWCASGGFDGRSPHSGYPPDMDAWMVFGPFSLADAENAFLGFHLWNSSEPGYDYLRWMVSIDGTHFHGYQTSGDSYGWQPESIDLTRVPVLGDVTGRSHVWIAFVFESDSSIQGEGAYIDEIVLRKYVPHYNTPPYVTAADIYDEPDNQTLYPTHTYSVRAIYHDADGAEDLANCWLRLRRDNSDTGSITFYWNQETGASGVWPGSDGAWWAELLSVTPIRRGDGYELRWTYRLRWQWQATNDIDFGIAAQDDAGEMVGWAWDATNAAFVNDLRVGSSATNSTTVEVGSALGVTGELLFAGTGVQPVHWAGIRAELRLGSPDGALLASATPNGSSFAIAWRPAPAHLGQRTVYITIANEGHAPPRSSDYWWDAHHVTVTPDRTPPAPPALHSLTHPSGTSWYASANPAFTWTPPADASGIAGYSYLLDQNAISLPDESSDTQTGSASWTGLTDGIWYLHVRAVDGAGNWGAAAHRAIRIDTAAPVDGNLRIAGGAAITSSLSVLLDNLGASDAHSGVARMRFSNNGTIWSPAQPLAANRAAWDLSTYGGSTQPGSRTVYARYADEAGNWSPPVTATIVYEPPPQSYTVVYSLDARGARYGEGDGPLQARGYLLLDLEHRRATSLLRWHDGTTSAIPWHDGGLWYTADLGHGDSLEALAHSSGSGDSHTFSQLYGRLHPATLHLGGRANGDVAPAFTGLRQAGDTDSFDSLSFTARIDIAVTRRLNDESRPYADVVDHFARELGIDPDVLPAEPAELRPATTGPIAVYTFQDTVLQAGEGALISQRYAGFLLLDLEAAEVRVVRAWRQHGQNLYRVETWDAALPRDHLLDIGGSTWRFIGGANVADTTLDFWSAYGREQTVALGGAHTRPVFLTLSGSRWSHNHDGIYRQSSFTARIHAATLAINDADLDLPAAVDYVLTNLLPPAFIPAP